MTEKKPFIPYDDLVAYFLATKTRNGVLRATPDDKTWAALMAQVVWIVTDTHRRPGFDHWLDREVAQLVFAPKKIRMSAYSIAVQEGWITETTAHRVKDIAYESQLASRLYKPLPIA